MEKELIAGKDIIGKSKMLARLASVGRIYEQRAVLYILSKLTEEDEKKYRADPSSRIEVLVSLNELCKECGLEKAGSKYDLLRSALKRLTRQEWQDYQKEDGSWGTHTVSYLSYADVNYKQGLVLVELHRVVMPHLLAMTGNYSLYEYRQLMSMTSLFSSQFYELLTTYRHNAGTARTPSYYWVIPKFTLAKIKEFFGVSDKYKNKAGEEMPAQFYRKVLGVAVDEINELTDISVTVKKTGTKAKTVYKFEVKAKVSSNENNQANSG